MKQYPVSPHLAKSMEKARASLDSLRQHVAMMESTPEITEEQVRISRDAVRELEDMIADSPRKWYKGELAQKLATRGWALTMFGTCAIGALVFFVMMLIPISKLITVPVAIVCFVVIGFVLPIREMERNSRRLAEASEDWLEAEVARKETSRRIQKFAGISLWLLSTAGCGVAGVIVLAEVVVRKTEDTMPPIPVVITYRPPISTDGYVLTISNNNNEPYRVKVTTPGRKPLTVVVAPGAVRELGSDDGLTLVAGDRFKVEVDGFRPERLEIPFK